MLRPATPLTIIYFVAFILLLLATISAPVVPSIALGSIDGINFGVLGYCNGNTCTGPDVRYPDNTALFDDDPGSVLNERQRSAVSSLLIVHPVAAFLTLVCSVLALAAHFNGPSHSSAYLLGLLILSIPTLLAALLAFLVDILLFTPHMHWGGWIVLVATILVIASSIVTCAMRRTLVSRKTREKRVAGNEDMNGYTYYETLAERQRAATVPSLARADSPPPMSGATAFDKTSTQYATYEMSHQDTTSHDEARSTDDRTPLTSSRPRSTRSGSTEHNTRTAYANDQAVPLMPQSMDGTNREGRNGMGPRRPSRDQYGNPIPSNTGFGFQQGNGQPPDLRRPPAQGPPGAYRGVGFSRGRGSYGPPPRGYGPPRGGYGPRGGFYNGPPPGFSDRGRGGFGPRFQGMQRGPPRPAPPGYELDPYYSSIPADEGLDNPYDEANASRSVLPSGPIGQAIEMNERTGSASQPLSERNSTDHAAGFNTTAREPTHYRNPSLPHAGPPRAPVSPVEPAGAPGRPSNASGSYYEDVDPRFADDVVHPYIAPATTTHPPTLPSSLTPGPPAPYNTRGQALPESPLTPPPQPSLPAHLNTDIPAYPQDRRPSLDEHPFPHTSDLSFHHDPLSLNTNDLPPIPTIDPDHPFPFLDSIPPGARSPGAGSENSHFTSVSQRGVNPNWQPPPGAFRGGRGGAAKSTTSSVQRQQREDMILSANPDFALPGMGLGGGAPRGGGFAVRGGRVPPAVARAVVPSGTGRPSATLNTQVGLTPSGRYPTDLG